jgi:IclR family KDG regulon transcriptional repressor
VKKEKSAYSIQAVTNALRMLELFQEGVDEIRLKQCCDALDLSKNNAFRLLATLEALNYLELNRETGGFRLGVKNLELGRAVRRQRGLLKQYRPLLETLVKQCNETANLVTLTGANVLNLDSVESVHPVRVLPRVGMHLPSYCTASGKLLLALSSEEQRSKSLAQTQFSRYTPHTVTDPRLLKQSFAEIAIKGYAVGDEELDLGVRGVAAPIRDYQRRVLGAIALFGPVARFSRERIQDELVPSLLCTAGAISERLGYLPAGGGASP